MNSHFVSLLTRNKNVTPKWCDVLLGSDSPSNNGALMSSTAGGAAPSWYPLYLVGEQNLFLAVPRLYSGVDKVCDTADDGDRQQGDNQLQCQFDKGHECPEQEYERCNELNEREEDVSHDSHFL